MPRAASLTASPGGRARGVLEGRDCSLRLCRPLPSPSPRLKLGRLRDPRSPEPTFQPDPRGVGVVASWSPAPLSLRCGATPVWTCGKEFNFYLYPYSASFAE